MADMPAFDPDAFLAQQHAAAPPQASNGEAPGGFDPDAFLAQAKEEKFGAPNEGLKANIEAAGRGLAGPLATAAEVGLGVPKENILEREKAWPSSTAATEGLTFAGSLFLPGIGEEAAAARAAKVAVKAGEMSAEMAAPIIAKGAEAINPSMGSLLGKTGEAVSKAIPWTQGESAAAKISQKAVQGAVEFGLYTGLDNASKLILNDPNASAQATLADMGLSSVVGGVLGAGVGAISPLYKAAGGTKAGEYLGKLFEDFKGRVSFRKDVPDILEASRNEIENLTNNVSDITHQAFSGGESGEGIKGDQIAKLMPKMSEEIANHVQKITNSLEETLAKMENNPKIYPLRLTEMVRNDLNTFKRSVIESPAAITGYDNPIEKYAITKGNITEIIDQNINPKVFEKQGYKVDKIPVFNEDFPGKPIFPDEMDKKIVLSKGQSLKSPGAIFNATQDLKRTIHSYAFPKDSLGRPVAVNPLAEDAAFSKLSKGLGHDLKTSLEDTKIWGKAADIQKEINSAISEFIPSRDAVKTAFTIKDPLNPAGERIINPGKWQAYVNAAGKDGSSAKARVELRNGILGEYLDKAPNFIDKINKIYTKEGLEAPFRHTSTSVLHDLMAEKTPGSKLADMMIEKGLKATAASGLGATTGAATASAMGLPAYLGSIVGLHALSPVFESALTSLAKPIMDSKVTASAFKSAMDYTVAVAKGERAVSKAANKIFKSSAEVITAARMPKDSDINKLKKVVDHYADNPDQMAKINNGHIGEMLPMHQQAVSQLTVRALQYLNSIKPKPHIIGPLDKVEPPTSAEIGRYNRALQIAEQPVVIFQRIKDGTLLPSDIADLHNMAPEMYQHMQQIVTNEMMSAHASGTLIPYKTRIGTSLFLGHPVDASMTPQAILAAQPKPKQPSPQQPQGKTRKGTTNLGKSNNSYRTASQDGESDRSSRD